MATRTTYKSKIYTTVPNSTSPAPSATKWNGNTVHLSVSELTRTFQKLGLRSSIRPQVRQKTQPLAHPPGHFHQILFGRWSHNVPTMFSTQDVSARDPRTIHQLLRDKQQRPVDRKRMGPCYRSNSIIIREHPHRTPH